MNISIVIPLYNEAESLQELCEWIIRKALQHHLSYEIIFVDDGSTDDSWAVIEKISSGNPNVKGIKFRRNNGKSAAVNTGFKEAVGDVIITMDADLQDNPDEVPALYNLIKNEGYDMVSGWKKKRHDPFIKTFTSRIFNWATRKMSGINNLHDFNCGLKAYRKEVIKSIELQGEMHRYIPVIVRWQGFKKIGEKEVVHLKRKYGETKFGPERFINGLLDLLSIAFVTRFGKRPMHLFGLFGMFSFLTGFMVTVWLIYQKLHALAMNIEPREITEQPLFYIALVAVIVGVQLFLTGFLAELIIRNSPDRNIYPVDKKINFS